MASNIADRVRELRETLGLNQAELARRGGLARAEVNAIEKGRNRCSSARIREALARVSGCEVARLSGYLAGRLSLRELFLSDECLDRAIAAGEGPGYSSIHWSPATIELARSLESELPKEKWPAVWIRRLDIIEKRVRRLRSRLKAQWAEEASAEDGRSSEGPRA